MSQRLSQGRFVSGWMRLALLGCALLAGFAAEAKLQTKMVDYKQGDTVLQGYLAWDDKVKGPMPAVVLVHNWMGMTDEIKKHTDDMAKQGFLALAADIYGKGVVPKDAKEAGTLAGKYKGDRNLLRQRAQAAMDVLTSDKRTDKAHVLAMGYCFGGTTVLELARTGAPLAGVVTFHGGLDSPKPEDGRNIKAKLLILHGAIDPYVPAADVAAFVKELNDAKVDYQFISYAGAVHSFTDKGAGDDISKGAAYNEVADRRSTVAMKDFVTELLQKK